GQIMVTEELNTTTMDTTGHEFQWEIIEFPSLFGTGRLYDVAIIDENHIWAVGEIYADSAQDWLPYNAVHWNGSDWELKKIYVDYRGQPNLAPLRGVFALPDGNVVFSSGLPYLPENGQWKLYHLWDMGVLNQDDGSVYSIWGTSLDNLYFAGTSGTIVRYNGRSWYKIESGTDLPILDIWGAKYKDSGEYEILCVAENYGAFGGSKIFAIHNSKITEIKTKGLMSGSLWGVWFVPERCYLAVGDGLWQTRHINETWHRNQDLPALFKTSVHGNDINDIVVCGAYWLLAHYNGMNWKTYFQMTSGSLIKVFIKDDLVIAVGGIGNNAVIVRGRC
ncbi:MAG: glucosyl transferase, partial [Calditrichaeota bacterium]|nr:glucosyl transferase [Calditrichota bacterium]